MTRASATTRSCWRPPTPVERFHVEDENSAAAMCYTSGTTGNPKGVVYSHRSMTLHGMATMLADTFGLNERDRRAPGRPAVPRERVGPCARGRHDAAPSLVMPGPDLSAPSVAKLIERGARDARGRRPDDLDGRPP